MERVRIARVDKALPLPVYETTGSVGFDLVVREDTVIPPRGVGLVPGNVIVAVPRGYMLVVAARSSMPRKKGLMTPHGIGIIDQDYCGPTDEIKVQVYNFLDEAVTVRRGEKIAQGVFVRVETFSFEEVDSVAERDRGGFGSTGGYAAA